MPNTSLARINESYLRQRGVALRFTTPIIRFARARSGPEGGREVVVPGLIGNRNDHVIPWIYLPELTPLTVHDRLLWETLSFSRGQLLPADAHRMAHDVAKSGVLGVARAEATRRLTEREAGRRHMVHAALLARLFAAIAPEAATELVQGARAGFRQDVVQHALRLAAAPLGLPATELFDRLGEIGSLIAEVGAGGASDGDNCLRGLHLELERFADSLHRFALEEPAESIPSVTLLLEMAEATRARLGALISAVDAALADIGRLATDPQAREALGATAAEAVWVADGWPVILAEWEGAATEQRFRQRELAVLLAQVVPPLPGFDPGRTAPRSVLADVAARDLLGHVDLDRFNRVARRAGRVVAA